MLILVEWGQQRERAGAASANLIAVVDRTQQQNEAQRWWPDGPQNKLLSIPGLSNHYNFALFLTIDLIDTFRKWQYQRDHTSLLPMAHYRILELS